MSDVLKVWTVSGHNGTGHAIEATLTLVYEAGRYALVESMGADDEGSTLATYNDESIALSEGNAWKIDMWAQFYASRDLVAVDVVAELVRSGRANDVLEALRDAGLI